MKIYCLFTFFCVLQVSAKVYPQSALLDIDLKNKTVREVLKTIEGKSQYRFFYNDDFTSLNKIVNLDVKQVEIDEILRQVFAGGSMTYKIMDNNVVVIIPASDQQQSVTGSVIDATTGEGIPGVSITIEGTTTGVVSDAEGKFSIVVTGPGALLIFSSLGYLTEKVMVTNQATVTVKLAPDIKNLEEIVVIGYGTQRKADLLGSVASVKGDELLKVSGANASTAFAGRMPGVMVTQSSGEPGAGASIKVRGIGSLSSNNDPLVLIDGFQGSLDNVTTSEIETISVLKDASSAAIYGSRAANGVILVTTKRGQKDKPLKVSITAKTGVQQATELPEILNTQQWIQKSNETRIGAGGTPYWVAGDPVSDPALQTTNFNWMDYLFRTAPVRDYNAALTGGGSKMAYAVNMGYYDQGGILIGENFKRANFRSNLDYIGKSVSMGASLAHFRTWNSSTLDRSYVLQNMFRTPPTIAAYNPNGTLSDYRSGYGGEVIENNTPAMDAAARDYNARQSISTVNLYAEIILLKGLKFKTIVNLKSFDGYNETFTNLWESYRPSGALGKTITKAKFMNADNSSFLWETQNLLTYKLDIENHHLNMLLGASAQKEKSNQFDATKTGFNRNDLHAIGIGGSMESINGFQDQNSLSSQFGRVEYIFRSKYMLQATVRRDGSSVFAPGHRWGVFPSFSAGWRISEEGFMKNVTAITNFKLRANYGILGNQGIPAYRWLGLMDFQRYVLNNKVVTSAQQTGLYTPDITWEKTATSNLGIDLSLWNKLEIVFDIYNKKTSDMLLEFPVPQTSGGGDNPFYNVGEMSNKGWDFVIGYKDRIGDFSYGVSFNMSHVKNKVEKLDKDIKYIDLTYNQNTYARTQVGQPLRSYYGYQVEGIWQKQSDTTGTKILTGGSKPGDFRYKDIDQNDTIDSRDRTFIGNPFPRFYYGGSLYASWKGIDVSILLQGVFDREIFVTPEYGMDLGRYDYSNVYKEFYDNTWRKEGDNSKYPQLGHSTANTNINSTWVQDASYLRIKNVELGYTIPRNLTSKIRVQEFRIFASATNLLTFTKYVGLDPEMDRNITYGGADYPQAKTYTIGVNLVF